jgi:chromate reductase, NAD(P)H dehydrogenase (quinone)
MVNILAISGSLRGASTNSQLLKAAELLAPADMRIEHYEGVGLLPHFSPDLTARLPEPVAELNARVIQADGVLISCPEYARGIPGSFKNALDWLVGTESFPGKPIALFNASARASAAQAALRLVLETMSARLVDEASITVELLSRKLDAQGIARDVEMAAAVRKALQTFAEAIAHEK